MARVQIEFPEPPLCRTETTVRISDINYGGHLGHDALISILHDARFRFFRHFGMDEADTDGCGLMIADLAIRYEAEAFHGQTLGVEISAGDVRSRGCDLIYRVTDPESGRTIALARTGVVFLDLEKKQVTAIPERFLAVIRGT